MTEELQVIVQAMTQLGSEARFAFVAWLIAKYGMPVVIMLIGAFVACKVIKALKEYSVAYRIAAAVQKACGFNWFGGTSDDLKRCLTWIDEKSK